MRDSCISGKEGEEEEMNLPAFCRGPPPYSVQEKRGVGDMNVGGIEGGRQNVFCNV